MTSCDQSHRLSRTSSRTSEVTSLRPMVGKTSTETLVREYTFRCRKKTTHSGLPRLCTVGKACLRCPGTSRKPPELGVPCSSCPRAHRNPQTDGFNHAGTGRLGLHARAKLASARPAITSQCLTEYGRNVLSIQTSHSFADRRLRASS